ncbi:MAG: ComEC/Rec2 family competence protein [Bryobacteraceae bacterium]|nr:ComEC/Rec2 family competence protein [Bryobacteraceae bacterium]
MRSVSEPLLLPALTFAAGIYFQTVLKAELAILATAFLALALLWILASFRYKHLQWPCAIALFLVAGAATTLLHENKADPSLDANPGEVVMLVGCVAGPVATDKVQSRFLLELEPQVRARVTLTVREGEVPPILHYGDKIEVEAKVRKPRNFQNPGAFDYAGYLRRDDAFWLASSRGAEKIHKMPGQCGSGVRRAVLHLRDELSRRISVLYKDDEYAARLMPALLVGDNSGLDRSWTRDFRRTGTYHAIVISGLHITVVAGTALLFMRWLGVPLTSMLAAGALLAWTYAGVADWQVPVVRSAFGFSLFLLARWFFRKGRILNLLAATALVLLAFDPYALFDPSFQLTFLSVAAIGALASPLTDRTFGPLRSALGDLDDSKRDLLTEPRGAQFRLEMRLVAETMNVCLRIPLKLATAVLSSCLRFVFWICEMALLSACVQLALLVPSIAYFHQVSITGILANLTVVPALSAAVPVGLLAAVTNSGMLAAVASLLLGIARTSTLFWASIEPGLRVPDALPLLNAGALAAASIAGACLILRLRTRWVVISGAIAIGFALVLILHPFQPDMAVRSLELTAIDVGQGDSLLVGLPDGKTMLIDGGGFPVFDRRIQPRLDIGEDVVSPYLWRRGIKHLDIVAITHMHDDHAAGMPAIIRNFRPSEVWTGAVPEASPLLDAVRAAANETGAKLVGLRSGDQRSGGGASITALSPAGAYVPSKAARNDDSLVLLISFGRHRFLLTGDAERRVESDLVSRGLATEIDVLKTGHHGSRTSTNTEFLNAARPLFALISVGEGNTYGHPYPDVIDRLNGAGARILRTDQNGLVQIRSNGRAITIERFSDSAGQAKAAVFDKGF